MKQFKTESKRILDLMVNSIYTNKEIFLRELISNASDAIDKLKFISLTDGNIDTDFKISITLSKEDKKLIIEDNGIGMNQADLEKNLGTIAESGTLAFKKQNEKTDGENLIGQFGVGFYSAFMVADKLEVETKKYGEDNAYLWVSSGAEGYSIKEIEKSSYGTKITIHLKDDTEDYKYSELLDQYKISGLVKQYSDYIRYPIEMEVTRSRRKAGSTDDKPEYEQYSEKEVLNSMVPLWKKPKSEVKDEDLSEFYKNEFHDYVNPLKSIYAKIEGTVNYDALLFIPAKTPYNFFTKDFKKGLKLYSNGVLIMESCEELLPDYFAFVKGVIDSADLSLNISREILQQDRQVKLIANGIEKKILAELKKMLEENREDYEKMFSEFGLSIKFGAYAGFGMNKDKLKDLIMFYSSRKQKLVTLKEYVEGINEGQTDIYYASGDNYETIQNLPKVKNAIENGYEVLLFKDDIDEFVVKILGEYDGKKFKLVNEASFTLGSEEDKRATEEKTQEYKGLLDEIKNILNDKVSAVRLSSSLSSQPVCLTSEGEISIEMEKVLNSMPNADGNIKANKVLEINAKHEILDKLNKTYLEDKEKLSHYVTVLYNGARLLEGLKIEDTLGFVDAISKII